MKWQHNEPFFWGLFGAGGVVATMVLPVILFIVGLAVPLGLMPAEVMSYDRMLAFASSWIGRLALVVVIALTLWHCMHRIYHSLHDLGYHPGAFARILCYGIAAIGSVAAITLAVVI